MLARKERSRRMRVGRPIWNRLGRPVIFDDPQSRAHEPSDDTTFRPRSIGNQWATPGQVCAPRSRPLTRNLKCSELGTLGLLVCLPIPTAIYTPPGGTLGQRVGNCWARGLGFRGPGFGRGTLSAVATSPQMDRAGRPPLKWTVPGGLPSNGPCRAASPQMDRALLCCSLRFSTRGGRAGELSRSAAHSLRCPAPTRRVRSGPLAPQPTPTNRPRGKHTPPQPRVA